jgi:hypothetical protein
VQQALETNLREAHIAIQPRYTRQHGRKRCGREIRSKEGRRGGREEPELAGVENQLFWAVPFVPSTSG